MITNQFQRLLKVVSTYVLCQGTETAMCFNDLMTNMVNHVNNLVKHHGIVHTVNILKAYQLHITRHLAGHPLLKSKVRIGLSKDGLPKILGATALELIRARHLGFIRMVLSLLSVHRMVPGDGTLDVSSIVAPSTRVTGNSHWTNYIKFVHQFVVGRGLNRFGIQWNDPHMTTKAGPNGHALGTSLIDLAMLPQEIINDVVTLGGSYLRSYIFYMIKILPSVCPTIPESGTLRKISVIRDKSCKNRPIAVFDYWTQTALRPVHDLFMEMLKSFSSDCTFNQDHELTLSTGMSTFHCMDLSSATDRFPADLQQEVVEAVLGSQKAQAWRRLMTNHKFVTPTGGEVSYTVGQPMGAYSSWAVFAVSHHLVVLYCASLCGHDPFKFSAYALLGDDIVIYDSSVAEKYREVIASFGVEISDIKSHDSESYRDFAKRLFYKGTEITPFPLHSVVENWNKPIELVSVLNDLQKRGWFEQQLYKAVPGDFVKGILSCFTANDRSIDRLLRMTLEMLLIRSADRGEDQTVVEVVNSTLVNSSPATAVSVPMTIKGTTRFIEHVQQTVDEYFLEQFEKVTLQSRRYLSQTMCLTTQEISVIARHWLVVSQDGSAPFNSASHTPAVMAMLAQHGRLEEGLEKVYKSTTVDIAELCRTLLSKVRIVDPRYINSKRAATVVTRLNGQAYAHAVSALNSGSDTVRHHLEDSKL